MMISLEDGDHLYTIIHGIWPTYFKGGFQSVCILEKICILQVQNSKIHPLNIKLNIYIVFILQCRVSQIFHLLDSDVNQVYPLFSLCQVPLISHRPSHWLEVTPTDKWQVSSSPRTVILNVFAGGSIRVEERLMTQEDKGS